MNSSQISGDDKLLLPDDLLRAQIFQRLSPEEVVSYCGTNRSRLNQCRSIPLINLYLINSDYPHQYFQRMIISASFYEINSFCKYLIEHAADLNQEIDDRTIWYAFGHCCHNRNKKLAVFLTPIFVRNRISKKETTGFYNSYPEILRDMELLIGVTPTKEERIMISEIEEEEQRVYIYNLLENIDREIRNLPLEFWCDRLVEGAPLTAVSYLRDFISISGIEDEYSAGGDVSDLFSWINDFKVELYSSYIRKGNLKEINHLVYQVVDDRVLIAKLLLGNLPDRLLYSFSDILGDNATFTVISEFKTYYKDRYINNLDRVNPKTLRNGSHFGSTLRYVYFALSPEEFFDIVNRISNKQIYNKYILEIADYAEEDGFTTWTKIVRSNIDMDI